jgi:hypothetical protein
MPQLKRKGKKRKKKRKERINYYNQTPQIVQASAITRGKSNNEPSINTVAKFIQMDGKLFKLDEILFKWMKNGRIG